GLGGEGGRAGLGGAGLGGEGGLGGGAVFHCGTIESFEYEGPAFDHVLSVRSYSHFEDVDRAAEVVARVLKPLGRWLVVGDTPVALLRTAEAARRGHADPGLRLEHFHNHSATEAWALLERHPFRCLERRDPDPECSNLWWLMLQRV
ncbi:MAG: methyltransferase domain-containing protein, partial [bacterium]